jgi:1-pyrroline-5-carboxylate dehydrogenase
MGSKNPAIITAHADLNKAVEGVTRSAFGYGGQKCSATSRVYIEAGIADIFLRRLKKRIEQIKVGDPRDREVFFGPLINEKAVNRFREAVAGALKAGGRLVTGGEVMSGGDRAGGYYVSPTVVSGLPRGHHLWRDELFMPFLLVDSYANLPEALELANETDFGLTSGIFSEDPQEVGYFFTHIRFGVCYANRKGGATTGAWPGKQSFVGWKASGSTGKGVGGPYYLFSFLREQTQAR